MQEDSNPKEESFQNALFLDIVGLSLNQWRTGWSWGGSEKVVEAIRWALVAMGGPR